MKPTFNPAYAVLQLLPNVMLDGNTTDNAHLLLKVVMQAFACSAYHHP